VNRSLLTPRWLLLHVLFAAAVVATGLLAWWQWDRAHGVGGTFQNLGYAFQWPLFGAFAVFLWYRLAIADRRQPAEDDVVSAAPLASGQEQEPRRPRRRPLVPPPAQPVTEDEDPELAAYNRYLAELDRSRRR
jgi:DNA-binding transcriptional regulator of glucitol operon